MGCRGDLHILSEPQWSSLWGMGLHSGQSHRCKVRGVDQSDSHRFDEQADAAQAGGADDDDAAHLVRWRGHAGDRLQREEGCSRMGMKSETVAYRRGDSVTLMGFVGWDVGASLWR